MSDWRLVQVKPNAGHIAQRNLARQGFETFQPLERSTIVRGGRFVDRLRPFFPGYLFLSHSAPHAPWSVVNSTYGVCRLVRFGDKPAAVPGDLVAELKSACDENDIIASGPTIATGCSVEVTFGTFTGFIGQVERLTPDHRALVLIEFLGKQTRASLPAVQLKIVRHQSNPMGAST